MRGELGSRRGFILAEDLADVAHDAGTKVSYLTAKCTIGQFKLSHLQTQANVLSRRSPSQIACGDRGSDDAEKEERKDGSVNRHGASRPTEVGRRGFQMVRGWEISWCLSKAELLDHC